MTKLCLHTFSQKLYAGKISRRVLEPTRSLIFVNSGDVAVVAVVASNPSKTPKYGPMSAFRKAGNSLTSEQKVDPRYT
jgi:hypothetical protein